MTGRLDVLLHRALLHRLTDSDLATGWPAPALNGCCRELLAAGAVAP